MKGISGAERSRRMLEDPIEKIIPALAVPTIISMLITSIYNMADTFFVGHLGKSQSGAVGVVFSAMAMVQALAFTIGMGSGVNLSKALGRGDQDTAERFVSTAFFTAFLTGVVVGGTGLLVLPGLVDFLGATETIRPHAMNYARFILIAAPFMMCSFVMNNLLRFQGMAIYGMVGITSGGVLNMILDPLLINGLGMGIAGAGLATAISQTVSFSILLFMCNSRQAVISIRFRNFRPSRKLYGKMLYNGMPSMGRQGIASVSTIVLNNIANPYGDAAISALSIVTRYTLFINSSIIGFGQGFQPVVSFNYGAGRFSRIRAAYKFCVRVALIILLVLAGVSFLGAPWIVRFFIKDEEVIRLGTLALRLQMATMPLWSFYTMNNMLTQSIGYGGRATIIACARQGLCLIPVLMVLPALFGINGLLASQPTADILSVILSLLIVRGVLNELASMPDRTDAPTAKAPDTLKKEIR